MRARDIAVRILRVRGALLSLRFECGGLRKIDFFFLTGVPCCSSFVEIWIITVYTIFFFVGQRLIYNYYGLFIFED